MSKLEESFKVENVYLHETKSRDPLAPEKALISATIERAIRDYLGYAGDIAKNGSGNYQAAVREARHWLFDPTYYPYSASWCFHQLNIDYPKALKKIKEFYDKRPCNNKLSKNITTLYELLRVQKN